MALVYIARSIAAGMLGKADGQAPTQAQTQALPKAHGHAAPRPAAETLTKYIPTEVVGIVTGAYALVIPVVKDDRANLGRWLLLIAAMGLVAMIVVLWIQVVVEVRKSQPDASLLSVPISGRSAGELALASFCYAAWVVSLMAGFLDQPLPTVAGVFTLAVIYLVEPARKLLGG